MDRSTGALHDGYSEHHWKALTGMCIAAGTVWLPFADFGVAVPTTSGELSVSPPDLPWADDAFSPSIGALVLVGGLLVPGTGRGALTPRPPGPFPGRVGGGPAPLDR